VICKITGLREVGIKISSTPLPVPPPPFSRFTENKDDWAPEIAVSGIVRSIVQYMLHQRLDIKNGHREYKMLVHIVGTMIFERMSCISVTFDFATHHHSLKCIFLFKYLT
jgi:hypothetical protein